MKTSWNYQDIIDFEYFCHRDKDTDETDLHRRDRNIFLSQPQPLVNQAPQPRRDLLHLWLAARLKSEFPGPEQKSPGALLGDTLRLAKNLAGVKGLVVGLVAGVSFFTYTGTTPVNVFHFLLFFVVSQLVLAGLVLGACLLRTLVPKVTPPSFYSLLLHGMLRRLAAFLNKSLLQNFDAGKRAGFMYAFNIFQSRSTVYGSLFYWPLFRLVQLFGVFFNLGLLAATMAKIATSDLAFGWQSTLQISSQMLHKAVQLVALPWSWFVPKASSYPSLAEIEGSRIILKDGMYHLATGDLIAWWPFLVLSLVFYGLLLRLAFTVFGRLLTERTLAGLEFDNAACLTVIRRMRTPLITTQAVPEPRQRENTDLSDTQDNFSQAEASHLLPQVMLVPDDIFGLCSTDKLMPLMRDRGFSIKSVNKFMSGYDEDEEIKNILLEQCRTPDDGLFILMEGWMPPLVSFATYLKDLREILPEKTMIHLGLVGRPMRYGFTPLAPQDLAIWRKKIATSRDPYLQVLSLIP
ncbi:MAG: DUF2868 domain-containing protein [Proteobacteria bacterium]|nr:DUF2868 domain-containing protein [Pseudomonadota bacterium]